ncbi:MAG: nitrogenase iron-molybdenum cofactor biosynthesis protein NifN [Nitrospinae bacterium]|nr:nitrogenase iron-molybdenum cofactor biosynthesis protein NifN [Nitrospinota bacterium]
MKHYSGNPIKLSQPAGAALAFMGVKGSIPMWHGAQGCTAFSKILFIQHFREPMPFQTTALTHTTVVMGGDGNALEAMENVKKEARFIGLLTTGVTEASGSDINRIAKTFAEANPGLPLVAVGAPDFEGSLETGYVKACEAMIKTLAKPRTSPRKKQVAVFAGPYVTPGEVEEIRNIIEDSGLRPVIFPDLGDSLNGYLADDDFSPCSIGGVTVEEIETLADSALTLSVGSSMKPLAESFAKENGLPAAHYDSLATIDELDGFHKMLSEIFRVSVPSRYRKQRKYFMDALLDTQFYFHGKRAGVAGDPEFVTRWAQALKSMGVEVATAVSIKSGFGDATDLEEFREKLTEEPVDILIGNSHVAEMAGEMGLPAVRSGMPVYDKLGEPQTVRMGYRGAAGLYMELANAFVAGAGHTEPWMSPLRASLHATEELGR